MQETNNVCVSMYVFSVAFSPRLDFLVESAVLHQYPQPVLTPPLPRAERKATSTRKNSPCLMGLLLLNLISENIALAVLLTICSSYDSHFPGSANELQARFKASSNFLKCSWVKGLGNTSECQLDVTATTRKKGADVQVVQRAVKSVQVTGCLLACKIPKAFRDTNTNTKTWSKKVYRTQTDCKLIPHAHARTRYHPCGQTHPGQRYYRPRHMTQDTTCINSPAVVFGVVVWIIFRKGSRRGGHVKEARVEEHKQIAGHTGPDKYVVVVEPCAPVVGEAPLLGQAGGDEDADHAEKMHPLEAVDDAPVRLLLRRHRRKPSLQLLLAVSRLLQRGGVHGVCAEVDVVVRLKNKNAEQNGTERRRFRRRRATRIPGTRL